MMEDDGWQGIRRPKVNGPSGAEAAAGGAETAPRGRPIWELEEEAEAQRRRVRRRGGAYARAEPRRELEPGSRPAPWTASLQVQRLLVLGMFGCVVGALMQTLREVGVDWPRAVSIFILAVLIFTAGITLGGRDVGRHYRRYTDYGVTDWFLLLVPIVLVLKLLPSLLLGPAAAAAEVSSWMNTPASFFDAYVVWGMLLVFVVWDFSLRVAEDLNRLAFQPGEAPPAAASAAYHEWLSSPYRFADHDGAWSRLMQQFFIGGYLLLILTGLSIIPTDQLTNPNRPDAGGIIPPVLIYYLLGLVLASQTSLDRLRASWLRTGTAIQPGLARRWLGFGLVLVSLAMVLALVLPTTVSTDSLTTLPVLGILLWPFRLLFLAFNWVISLLATILFAPFSLLLPQAGGGGASGQVVPVQPTPVPVQVEPAGGFPSPLSRIIWAVLFYVLPGALAAFAIWNTWKKRRAIGEGLSGIWREVGALLWGGLLDLIATLWRLFSLGSPRLMRWAPEAIKQRWRQRPRLVVRPPRPGWLRLRGLDPRALIHYFYLSTAQRAEDVGWRRRQGQTPYEYSRDLAQRLPDRQDELETLTEAFVRARYSRAPVAEADVQRARTPWERLRGALQARRRARQIGAWFGLDREE